MDLRLELLPPYAEAEIGRLARLADTIDGARRADAAANVEQFNCLAGTALGFEDFQFQYEAGPYTDWVRRVLAQYRVKPVPGVTRAELVELVRRIKAGGADMEAYMAVFDANVPLPGASMLVVWPADHDDRTDTWDGGRPVSEYDPTPEQVVDWALAPNASDGPTGTPVST